MEHTNNPKIPYEYLKNYNQRRKLADGNEHDEAPFLPTYEYPEPNNDPEMTEENPKKKYIWRVFVVFVTAMAAAGLIMGAYSLAKHSEVREYLVTIAPLISFSFDISQSTVYSSESFCTSSLYVRSTGDSPDSGTGTFTGSGIVAIQRTGQGVHVNIEFRPSNETLNMGENQPAWTSPSIFYNLSSFINYLCIPPILNWTYCPIQSGMCNNIKNSHLDNIRYYGLGESVLPVLSPPPTFSGIYPMSSKYCIIVNGFYGTTEEYYVGSDCLMYVPDFIDNPGRVQWVSQISQDFYYETDADSTWTPPEFCKSECFRIPV